MPKATWNMIGRMNIVPFEARRNSPPPEIVPTENEWILNGASDSSGEGCRLA